MSGLFGFVKFWNKIQLPTMPRTGQNLVVLRVGGRVAGSNGNNANSASVEVEVEAEFGNSREIVVNNAKIPLVMSLQFGDYDDRYFH